jgi:hypothetical protein
MIRLRNVLAVAAIAAIATPLAAQERGVILKVMGGGYSHTMNLNTGPDFAHFKAGIALNAGLGIQANKYFAVMGDFTFAQTRGLGDVSFVNDLVYRYYYGAQLQLRYPLGKGLAPYLFGGGGRVHVDQKGIETVENFQHFTRNAGLFGAGFTWAVPNTNVALLAEGKGMYYKWVAAPFNRNQLDISYSVGVSYRVGF